VLPGQRLTVAIWTGTASIVGSSPGRPAARIGGHDSLSAYLNAVGVAGSDHIELDWLTTPIITALVTLLAGWFIGQRITDRWERARKQRELDLSALGELYSSYGEFYAVLEIVEPVSRPQGIPFRKTRYSVGAALACNRCRGGH